MLQSINLDNIPDDALFDSGTDGWNQNSATGAIGQTAQENGISVMTLQNQEDARNAPGVEPRRLNIERQDPNQRQILQPVTRQVRPPTPPEVLMAVFEPNNRETQPQPSVPRQELGNGGARAKTTKNKENKNKNATVRKSGVNERGLNEGRSRHSHSPDEGMSSKWQPELHFKRYDDDEENETGSSLTNRKIVNQTKQKKQNINRNTVRSRTAPLTETSKSDDISSLKFSSIPFPAAFDPVSNPQNIERIYIKNVGNGQQNGESLCDNDLETDFHSVHHLEPGQNSSQRILETRNITHIRNNLWEEKNKEINKGNINLPHVVFDATQNNAESVIPNDLDIDSLRQDDSTTVVKLTNNLTLQRSPSNSGLDSQSIVVPYEHNTPADNRLQINSMSATPGSSPQSIVTTISFNTSPTSTFTNSLLQDSLNFSGSLPSSLSSNVLFGEGVSNDYLYAQRLQQQYDREHEALQRRRQYDVVPSERTYVIPAEEHLNQLPMPVPAQNGDQLNTADYTTANEFQTLNASLTSAIEPVYVPNEIESPTPPHEPFYIPLENQTEARAEVEDDDDENSRPANSEIFISHQIENDVPYPDSFTSRDPIVVRFEGASDISPPESAELTLNSLVTRRSRAPQEYGEVDDAAYARRIQEEQDEELARMLQEQESETEHEHRGNLVNLEHNNTRRNYQPLHTRFGHTWRSRPLRVGPNLGSASNNVADSRLQIRNTWDRPLQQRRGEESEFAYLDNVHNISPVNEGYDIPPGQDYYYRYQNDPDFMLDEHGEDRLISINRDPQLLATLLMTRAPDMMIPNDIDLNDYEALWELAENLGEVRRVGMDQSDLSILPIHVYKAPTSGQSDDNKTDCLVCLSEFKDGERLKTLPCCHIYHVDCIDEWLRRNAICPVCRQPAVQR